MELGIWIIWLVRAPWITVTLLMVIAWIPSYKLRLFHELVWRLFGRGKILLPSSSQVFTLAFLIRQFYFFSLSPHVSVSKLFP